MSYKLMSVFRLAHHKRPEIAFVVAETFEEAISIMAERRPLHRWEFACVHVSCAQRNVLESEPRFIEMFMRRTDAKKKADSPKARGYECPYCMATIVGKPALLAHTGEHFRAGHVKFEAASAPTKAANYASDRVFDGVRPLSPDRVEMIRAVYNGRTD